MKRWNEELVGGIVWNTIVRRGQEKSGDRSIEESNRICSWGLARWQELFQGIVIVHRALYAARLRSIAG